MTKLIHREELNWKGTVYDVELYEADEFDTLAPVTQVQAVLFVTKDQIVIYKDIDGYYGLPGGSIEPGESLEQALRREVKEESACEIMDFGPLGFMKNTKKPGNSVSYQVRYWAQVKLLDEPVHDPCGTAISREVVSLEEAAEKLKWGERGKILLKVGLEKFKKFHGQ